MRKLLLFWLTFQISVKCAAFQSENRNQNSIQLQGTVVDSLSGLPLEYATISISGLDGKVINGATTNANGQFKISDLTPGTYLLTAESIGYQKLELQPLALENDKELTLPGIKMVRAGKNLESVVVTAQKKLIENRIDKMVYNAENDLTSQGGVATDVLKKVPQVSVDIDGNVQLAGNSSVRFLIDGKPSTAYGSRITDVLQSIPASQIKSIEVITNPGVRYDAQGLGGIINIILKKNRAKGISALVSVTGGTRQDNGSLNITARKSNFGINGFVSGNYRAPVESPFNYDRLSTDSLGNPASRLLQNGTTSLTRQGMQAGVSVDWTLKQNNEFNASINIESFQRKDDGFYDQQLLKLDSVVAGDGIASYQTNWSKRRFRNTDLAFEYKHPFKKEDQHLDFLITTSLAKDEGKNNSEQFGGSSMNQLQYGIHNSNPGYEDETEIELNFTQPVSKNVKLDVGLKTSLLDLGGTSYVNLYDSAVNKFVNAISQTTALSYHQQVYAGYGQISFPVGKLFNIQVGSRFERTEYDATYSNVNNGAASPGYNTLVPSVIFFKKLGESQVFKLSYSKRIERPDYRDLNPFINTSDPKNITMGNPYLKPEIGQRIEFAYSKDFDKVGTIVVTAFYRHNSQDIQPFVRYYSSLLVGDSLYTDVAVSSRENIGNENNLGMNLFSEAHLNKKLDIRTNIFGFHRNIINKIDKGNSRQSFNYRINLNSSYAFSNTFAAEFFGNFNSARNEVQGKYPSFTTYSLALRKQFAQRRGSLAITAVNPFRKNVTQRLELYGPNFSTTSVRQIPFRSFGINFTWHIGSVKFQKEPAAPQFDFGT